MTSTRSSSPTIWSSRAPRRRRLAPPRSTRSGDCGRRPDAHGRPPKRGCKLGEIKHLRAIAASISKLSHLNGWGSMTQYFGLDWLAMSLTFAAIYLLGNKNRGGFVIMMIGNLCWSGIGLWAHSYAMIAANLGFFSMNVRAF